MNARYDAELAALAGIVWRRSKVDIEGVVGRVRALLWLPGVRIDKKFPCHFVHHPPHRLRLAVRELPDEMLDDVPLHERALARRDQH